jgi:thiol-disulfide isomerase/thioredoxin
MRKWLTRLALASILATPALAEEPMPLTSIHKTLASQTGWLNTSRAITAEDLKGRILLLDFWTFCCINCIHVIPDLKYLEEKFGDDLTVIGVHSAKFANERDSENIRSAILRYDLHHPVVNDFDFSIWKKFGVRAWPTFVLINPDGIIEEVYSGEGNRAAVEEDIETLRSKYAGKLVTVKLPIVLEKDKAPAMPLSFPGKLAYAPAKDVGQLTVMSYPTLFVSDSGHHQIAIIELGETPLINTRIGSGNKGFKDGSFAEAEFNTPQGVLYQNGKLYIADTNNHALRVADLQKRMVTTLAGTGKQGYERQVNNAPALKTPLASPWDLAFYPDDKHIVIAMAGTHQLWSYDIEKKTVSVIAGNGRESIDDGRYPYNSLSQPSGLAVHDGKLYFVDSETSSLRVLENGSVTTLIGTGLFDFGYKEGKLGEALMQHSIGVYADASGVYVADSYNHSIRRYDPATGVLHNFAGHGVRGKNDGAAKDAAFNEPNDVLKIGDVFYVADTNNNVIRVLKNGKVSTLPITKNAVANVEFSEDFPNLESTPAMDIAASATVSLQLQKGWKINHEAPSALTLFDMSGKPTLVTTFSLKQIETKSLALPTLKPGIYRLQGTLYYCEDKEGAQCLIKSFDVTLNVKADGKKEISLTLN